MVRDSPTSLAPGFRFHPTDEELVRYYLRRKISGRPFRFDPISVIDIYRSEPWDLPGQSKLRSRDLEWYFFSALDKKYGNGSRTNRATGKGYWKTTGKDRPVKHNSKTVGMKKTLVYHIGRAPQGTRTNWVMHEYKLVDDDSLLNQGVSRDSFVLCRIFQKSGSGPKNGEQYGAPFIEEEWEEDGKEGFLPGEDALSNEVVAVDDFFLEANDLDQNFNLGTTSEYGPRPLNFYHGESSNYVENYEGFAVIDQKPVVDSAEAFGQCNDQSGVRVRPHTMQFRPDGGKVEMLEPCNNHSLGMILPCAVESNSVAEAKSLDKNVEALEPNNDDQSVCMNQHYAMEGNLLANNYVGEPVEDENPLDFCYSVDDLFLDATHYLVADNCVGDGSFLETNDLANPIGKQDPAGSMLDEYLPYFDPDEDITQYINFDVHETSEDLVPVQSCPTDEQLVNDVLEPMAVASSCNVMENADFVGSSSKQKAEMVKFDKDVKSPCFEKANHMLGSIPAPPAFASEYPTKDDALRLHAAEQSSSSVDVTAAMIRIRNITLRSSGSCHLFGKNGNVDIILSSYIFPSYAAVAEEVVAVSLSGIISGKAASFVLHGWMFLMFFWVLVFALSCKMENFMYTGK